VAAQKNRGTVRHGDLYPGGVAVIKGSEFMNSKVVVEMSPRLAKRFFRENCQTDVAYNEFKV
jgi:hypothetical protein